MAKQLPQVVIVGRMNVGKSTLFNKLAEDIKSITLDYAGVTRDVLKDTVEWQGKSFELIDTGGIQLRKTSDHILETVRQKALAMLEQAEIVLFVVDGKAGVMAEDKELAHAIRKKTKHLILVVNKVDVKNAREQLYDFYALPHDAVVAISAEHGQGLEDVLEEIASRLPATTSKVEEDPAYRVVFLGRPNVGKSSLMNKLLDEERSIVADMPGTTREAVTEMLSFYKENLTLTDTPGIRRKRAVNEEVEQLMVKSSFRALKRSDIVVLMIDASQAGLVDQELKLAFYAFEEQHKGLIILVNKADLLDEYKKAALEDSFSQYPHLLDKVPVLYLSCKTGQNIGRVLPLIKKVKERYYQEIERDELSELLLRALRSRPLMHAKQELVVRRLRQLAKGPFTLGLATPHIEWFGPSQLRFFENILRKKYDFVGAPIRFILRKRL